MRFGIHKKIRQANHTKKKQILSEFFKKNLTPYLY